MSQTICPTCKHVIKLSEKISGRKVKCKCGTVLRMPKYSAPLQVNSGVSPDELVHYRCPACNRRLAMKSSLAGKRSQCPCGVQVRVPKPVDPVTPLFEPEPISPAAAIIAPVLPHPTSPSDIPPVSTNDLFARDDLLAPPPIVTVEPLASPSPTGGVNPFATQDPFATDAPAAGLQPVLGNPHDIVDAVVVEDPFAADDLFATNAPPAVGDPFAANQPGHPDLAAPTQDPFATSAPFTTAPLNSGAGFMSAASAAPLSNVAPKYRRAAGDKKKRIVNKHMTPTEKQVDYSSLAQVLAGVGMMIGAVAWFYVGYQYGEVIFLYPPILFFSGLIAAGKGFWSLMGV